MYQQLNPSQASLVLDGIPTGQRLVPREGTPLARIVRQTLEAVGLSNLAGDEELTQEQAMQLIINSTKANKLHEELVVEVVTDGKNRIERQLRFIRNDVRDTVEKVFEKVEATLDDKVKSSEKYIVEEATLPEVVEHQIVTEAIKRIGSGMVPNINHGIFPALTNADIESLILALSDDKEIKTFLESLPVPMNDIYNATFRNDKAEGYPSQMQYVSPFNQQFAVIQNTFVILLAEAMQNKTPPGVNASQAELVTELARLVRKHSASVAELPNKYRDAVKSGIVVCGKYSKDFKHYLIVNSMAFEEFKAKGGRSDHVIASAILGNTHYVGNVISDNILKHRLEEAYKSYMTGLTLELNEQRNTIVTQTVAIEVSKLINENDVELGDLGFDKTSALARMREVLSTTRFHGQEDVYQFVRSVVCRTLYSAINAEYALEGIDKYCKENEEFTVREAALLVMRDLLTLWLSSQMELA